MLFADCRGFTALMQEKGPETVRALVDPLFRRCGEIVANHDGIVDHFMGDAIMAFFNVPILREDHLAKANSSAVQMHLAARAVAVAGTDERPLRLGIGITTGLAFAGKVGSNSCGDYTVLGDVVNLASRLQGQANPGETMVSEEVYREVRDAFPNARPRTVQLKGVEGDVRAFVLS